MPRVSRQEAWKRLDADGVRDLILADLDTNDDEHTALSAKLDTMNNVLRSILISVTVGTLMLAINLVVLFVRG